MRALRTVVELFDVPAFSHLLRSAGQGAPSGAPQSPPEFAWGSKKQFRCCIVEGDGWNCTFPVEEVSLFIDTNHDTGERRRLVVVYTCTQ